MMQTTENWLKPWQRGTHLRGQELFNENLGTRQGLDGFQKSLRPYALDESSLSIGKVKPGIHCPFHMSHNNNDNEEVEGKDHSS